MLARWDRQFFQSLHTSKLRELATWLGFGQKRCAACGAPFFPVAEAGYKALLCENCQQTLAPWRGPACQKCGLPACVGIESGTNSRTPRLCAGCAQFPPPWDSVAYYGLYQNELRDLILRLKFDGAMYVARLLAEFLAEACQCLPKPDALAAIPMYYAGLRRRGYNQAHEIAASFARLSGLPFRLDILVRSHSGVAQELLNASQRRQNLQSAFTAASWATGKNIWLIDDVVTTGSTCRAAARALKQAGAKAVPLLFVARTTLA